MEGGLPKQELDVEDGGGVAVSRMDGNARGRSLLSRVSKMYDIDGDGELNAAERALREMDTSNRGFITNERAYKLMTEHMDMQREMFKMKKVRAIVLGASDFVMMAYTYLRSITFSIRSSQVLSASLSYSLCRILEHHSRQLSWQRTRRLAMGR